MEQINNPSETVPPSLALSWITFYTQSLCCGALQPHVATAQTPERHRKITAFPSPDWAWLPFGKKLYFQCNSTPQTLHEDKAKEDLCRNELWKGTKCHWWMCCSRIPTPCLDCSSGAQGWGEHCGGAVQLLLVLTEGNHPSPSLSLGNPLHNCLLGPGSVLLTGQPCSPSRT